MIYILLSHRDVFSDLLPPIFPETLIGPVLIKHKALHKETNSKARVCEVWCILINRHHRISQNVNT